MNQMNFKIVSYFPKHNEKGALLFIKKNCSFFHNIALFSVYKQINIHILKAMIC